MCRHTARQRIPCDPELSRLAGHCLNNTYNEMRLGACPKCSGIATASSKTRTYPDRRRGEGSSTKEAAGHLISMLNSQGKRTMGSIKELLRSVSKRTLSRKNSKVERVKQVAHSPESADAVTIPWSSEQLAEEYRSLLGEHPSLQETDSEPPPSPATSRDIETCTTWSGLMARATGTAGSDVWRRGERGRR